MSTLSIDDASIPETIGYRPVAGYSSCGSKLKEEVGLLDCIVDGYGDFPLALPDLFLVVELYLLHILNNLSQVL